MKNEIELWEMLENGKEISQTNSTAIRFGWNYFLKNNCSNVDDRFHCNIQQSNIITTSKIIM